MHILALTLSLLAAIISLFQGSLVTFLGGIGGRPGEYLGDNAFAEDAYMMDLKILKSFMNWQAYYLGSIAR